MSRHVVAACMVCAGLTGGPVQFDPHSQSTPAQQPVFKGRIDIVRTEVAVIDTRTGKPVTGLAEGDFTVFENGVQQTIATFLAESTTPPVSPAIQTPPIDAAASPNRRVFLIMISNTRIQGPMHAYDGVTHFLRERLRPQDLAAVMSFNRATSFTTDHEQLARVVEQLQARGPAVHDEILKDAVRTEGMNADISSGTQAAIDRLFRAPGDTADTVRNVTTMLLDNFETRRNARAWYAWNRQVVRRDLLKVYAGIEYLRHLEGEKHIFCVTNSGLGWPNIRFLNDPVGMRMDDTEDDKRLAARANDAHVSLDILHTVGAFRGFDETILSSENVTELTAGQFTGTRTAAALLTRIDDATRNGYALGYVPANPALDGTYRNITVKVNRKDVTVVFRHGYTARSDVPPIDIRELMTRQRLRDAAASDIPQDDIKLQARASATSGAGPARQVRVELTIDASRLSLTQVGDRREGVIDLMILCGDAKQHLVGSLSQQMTLSLDEDHYRQALSGGIPYVAAADVTGTATRVKVLVYDYDSDRLGVVYVKLK